MTVELREDNARISEAYRLAAERYAQAGTDTEAALDGLDKIPIALHCWQGDDVGGFENPDGLTGGGIQATGDYPGKARTADELRADLEQAYRLIPGRHRLNLHAIYAETNGRRVERNELEPRHFAGWIEWAAAQPLAGLDFNPTFFSHPNADSGFTLASKDAGIRRFWVEHGIACRRIGAHMGEQLGSACVNNVWVPDGYKDTPVERLRHRELLRESLDALFAERHAPKHLLDAVESKLFGIGSESYVVGSHEFYLSYALKNNTLLCLDTGHFHPTESIADKISAVLPYLEGLLLHVSRGVRWDSDHVVTLSDELMILAQELVHSNALQRVHIGLDYFDASINRVAAWVIGTRCMIKALLAALLLPWDRLREAEEARDFTTRLALQEEAKTLPFGAVWDQYCLQAGVPAGDAWLREVKAYEQTVLSKRT